MNVEAITRPGQIACPNCGAEPGTPCKNPLTGEPYRSGAPHIDRITEARRA